MSPQIKLLIGAGVVACATAYLAWLGASTSWQYYVLVDECTQDPDTFLGHRMRVSGRVATDSLQISDNRSNATFVLRGAESELHVSCRGPLPDNLAEDMEVVVEGRLNQRACLQGDKVITRCASKYQATGDNTGARDTASIGSATGSASVKKTSASMGEALAEPVAHDSKSRR